jgi:hypothetical protein
MTDTEKLAIAVQALRDIANAKFRQPYTTTDSFRENSCYYDASGGNADDGVEIGRDEGAWDAANDARRALDLLSEPFTKPIYYVDDE